MEFRFNYACRVHRGRAIRPPCENMTSSAKPEVHNASHCRRIRTEPARQHAQKFGEVWTDVVFELCERADRQTDRQTDIHADHNTPLRKVEWKRTDGQTDGGNGITFHANAVGKNFVWGGRPAWHRPTPPFSEPPDGPCVVHSHAA